MAREAAAAAEWSEPAEEDVAQGGLGAPGVDAEGAVGPLLEPDVEAAALGLEVGHLVGADPRLDLRLRHAQADAVPMLPQPADTIPTGAGGPGTEAITGQETVSEVQVTADVVPDEPSEEVLEVDGERMERIKQLAKVYEQMNASSVAAIVGTMNEEDAVDILANMKPRNAAKVLASLAPEKAATLSLRLTE